MKVKVREKATIRLTVNERKQLEKSSEYFEMRIGAYARNLVIKAINAEYIACPKQNRKDEKKVDLGFYLPPKAWAKSKELAETSGMYHMTYLKQAIFARVL